MPKDCTKGHCRGYGTGVAADSEPYGQSQQILVSSEPGRVDTDGLPVNRALDGAGKQGDASLPAGVRGSLEALVGRLLKFAAD